MMANCFSAPTWGVSRDLAFASNGRQGGSFVAAALPVGPRQRPVPAVR